MDRNENRALFAQAPVGRAVVSLVAPTVISQLITVIYNMADTFFIGQIGDPNRWRRFLCACPCSCSLRAWPICSALAAPA